MAEGTVSDRRVAHLPVRSLRVEVVSGPDAGRTHRADADRLTVGSAPGNDLVLADDRVSRYHLEIARTAEGILVADNGSTNGTLLGRTRIVQAYVPPGTVLAIGKSAIRVDDGDDVGIELAETDHAGGFVGRTAEARRLMATIARAAASNVSILIHGETGSGKEVIARAVHDLGGRAGRPFETVDCGALMPTLTASELFGHEKGAFTGADERYVGAFERADGGTLFLDEIGELPASIQAALLGALERRSFRRLGGAKPIDVDVRVLAATHRDLRAEVNAGTFRQDLYYRLAVLHVRVPPLRERAADIPLLVEHFLREAGYDGDPDAIVPARVMAELQRQRWPGNARELRNFVEVALALGEVPALDAEGREPSGVRQKGGSAPPTYREARDEAIAAFEESYLKELLDWAEGNVSLAARHGRINRSYLTQKLKRYGVR